MAKLKIQDGSGDKDFFTMLPNFVLNHSTAIDQALYCQMKRYAGEDGQCFATEQTLCKKLGIGRRAYWKARDYLLSRGWVSFIGVTGGKTRPIKTYKVNNIWQENSDYYKKISVESNISIEKDMSHLAGDKSQKQHKISAEKHIEEEPSKEEPIKKTISKDIEGNTFGNTDINSFIEVLKREFELNLLDGSAAENRKYAYLAIKKCGGLDIAKAVIKAAAADSFYGDKIASVKKLYYHMAEIVQKARGNKQSVVKIR